jgi:peptidoglycan/LPS O-acetylase OafA/YrhL
MATPVQSQSAALTGSTSDAGRAKEKSTGHSGPFGFRADIEGLRAIAILLVVLYHAGWSGMSGGYLGVDVFFVLSGYLITGILIQEITKTGTVSLVNFWARRARRLLPAGTAVVLAVLVVNLFVMSPFEQIAHAHTARAFAVYASNILFAARSTDYFAGAVTRDPLLHTWSLSVEEQFYIFFAPLLLFLAWRWMKRGEHVFIHRFLWTTIAVSIISFIGCLALLHKFPVVAFYSLPSRAWEFGMGALTVLVVRRMTKPLGGVYNVVPVIALVGLVAISATLGEHAAHPGWVTLIPTLCTVALIITGAAGAVTPMTQLLTASPMRLIGRLSYSWYLWHWPALVVMRELVDKPSLALSLGVAVASIIPAAVTYQWIESPIRFSKRLQKFPVQAVVAAIILAISTAMLAQLASMRANKELASPRFAPILAAQSTIPKVFGNGCHLNFTAVKFGECSFGAATSDTTIVLFGDSHSAQWFPPLELIAKERGWKLVSLTKSACPAADVTVTNAELQRSYTECDTWRVAALKRIADLHPLAVVMTSFPDYELISGSQRMKMSSGDAARSLWQSGLAKTVQSISTSGARVVVLEDTPRPGFIVPDCLVKYVDQPQRCAFDPAKAVDTALVSAERRAVSSVSSARYISMNDVICEPTVCPTMKGGFIRYEDDHHIAVKYAESLAPELSRRLIDALR